MIIKVSSNPNDSALSFYFIACISPVSVIAILFLQLDFQHLPLLKEQKYSLPGHPGNWISAIPPICTKSILALEIT